VTDDAGPGVPRISARKTLEEARVAFYFVALVPALGWFLAASANAEGPALFFVATSPVLTACGVALLVHDFRQRNRDGRIWLLALATLIAAMPIVLLAFLVTRMRGVGPLFP
jgi:hypothetical protein